MNEADKMVRYCPECGSTGPIQPPALTCCPDSFGMSIKRWQADKLERMLAELRVGAGRYEFLRRLAPIAHRDLWDANIRGEGPFDSLVDAARAAERTTHAG